MRQEHRPGAALQVDYAGDTVVVMDGGQAREAQIFVACLPFSGLIYAEATWSQQVEDWLGAHVRALGYLGGVPGALVPDNLKSGVTRASFFDPVLNPSYYELARHYGTAVLPTRVRKPKDKAAVESARMLQRLGCRVLGPVGSALEAIDLLHRTRPDLALLDPALPEWQLEQVIATLETRNVPLAFTTARPSGRSLKHPALPEAAFRPYAIGKLERLLGQLLQTKDVPEPGLPLVHLRERIGHQCRVIAALAAADRDTNSAEAALQRLERSLTRLQAGTMVAAG
jgi:hypothetical protein